MTIEIIEQLKEHVHDDIRNAQKTISSNMHLLCSVHCVDEKDLIDSYDEIMGTIDDFLNKLNQI